MDEKKPKMYPTDPKSSFNIDNIPKVVEYEGKFKTANDYAVALREWVIQVHQIQCFSATMPIVFANAMQAQKQQQSSQPTTQQQQTNATPNAAQPNQRGVEYIVPPLWKRMVAEMIDFFLLFIVKLAATYIAVDFFDVLDLDNPIYENLSPTLLLTDYKATMNITWDILVLEYIYRIGNCVFEALCLHRGRGGAGGATPGKKMMGLKVVRCQWSAPTLNDQIIVSPATDIGLGRAFLRAFFKNIAITFLFPVCIAMLMYQHNRTFYDIFSESIVVEEVRPNRRNAQNNANR